MKKYILGILFAILSLLFLNAYLNNHTYYYDMLSNFNNYLIIIVGLFSAFIPLYYLFFSKEKYNSKSFLIKTFLGFYIFFVLSILINSYGIIPGFFMLFLNYLILFLFFIAIIVGMINVGNVFLKKIIKSNENNIYSNILIMFASGMGIIGILLYFMNLFSILNIYTAYLIFLGLIIYSFYKRKELKTLLNKFDEKVEQDRNNLRNGNKYIKYIYLALFLLSIFYIYIGFNYTFIPYPTAWDANHAYMFIPKVLAEYGGYPWGIDFRPNLSFWSGILSWIYLLGSWTRFSSDTWMIVFNFISAIVVLISSILLINLIVKLFLKDNIKIKLFGYLLLIAFLTSGNSAFLVFVDNKTDLATLMFSILGLFLFLYGLNYKKENTGRNNYLYYFILSGFFFGIANFIKPTATFDFFETILLYTNLEIGILLSIAAILFVIGIIGIVNLMGAGKFIPSSLSKLSLGLGTGLGLYKLINVFSKKKEQIIILLLVIFSFITTLIITKGSYGILKQYYDKDVNTNIAKMIPSLIMEQKIKTIDKSAFTGSLYKGLKEVEGGGLKEDNGRYVGYGKVNFGNPWWAIIIPNVFKEKPVYDKKHIDILVDKIMNNIDMGMFNVENNYLLKNIISSNKLDDFLKEQKINFSGMNEIQKEQIAFKIIQQLQFKAIKDKTKNNLLNGIYDIKYYPDALLNSENMKLLEDAKYKFDYNLAIPYKYLVPFNVVFNWSLQNLSSYYTDIGFIWLLLFFIIIIALIKSIIQKDKILFAFSFSTLIGWIIWYFTASGIIWYNIGGFIWLIITTLIYLGKYDKKNYLLYVLSFTAIIGIFLNLIRISTQGHRGIMAEYQMSVGKDTTQQLNMKTGKLEVSNKLIIPYKAENIFKLQFKEYYPAISGFNNRKLDEVGIIGGTYARYFIKNQNKIIDDSLLTYFWKLISDNDLEKIYKRIKDKNIKTILYDTAIVSVVQGDGNKTLWYRYYGKTDGKGNILTGELGVYPILSLLGKKGYFEKVYTNNLAIKYALTLTDEELSKILKIQDKNELNKIRFALTSLKYLPRLEGSVIFNKAFNSLGTIISYRLLNEPLKFAKDINDIYMYNLTEKDIEEIYTKIINKDPSIYNLKGNKLLFALNLNGIFNELIYARNNPNIIHKLVGNIIKAGIDNYSNIIYIKIK